ncbi:MAG: threonine aldolase [Robiginitomaculum sp.]|nr:threonine aldolase [Robiginitomaculum sp.]
MNFASDTAAPAHPKVIEHLIAANAGPAVSYGADGWTLQAESLLSDMFEAPLRANLVSSGTACNALALSLICPPTAGIICHPQAHINCDERGAVEFYSHGAKLLTTRGEHGRIDTRSLQVLLQSVDESFVHAIPPKAISLSNLSESGTCYSPKQVAELTGLAKSSGLTTHMDGARLANALAFLAVRPGDITWGSGIDVLSFGLTKTGAMAAEAVILFGEAIDKFDELQARRKRAGHLPPKQRFIAAQIIAMLENNLWLETASHANQMAKLLEEGLRNSKVNILHPVEGNEVFAQLSPNQTSQLRDGGVVFYSWPDGSARFVTSWNTMKTEIGKALVLL